jgi:multidrug efflux pump subunit AcrB
MVTRESLLHEAQEMRTHFTAFFIHNWHVTLLILIALVAGGVLSLISIPKESDPEVAVPYAVVNIAYPGASPSDVEQLITDRMEERLNTLQNVKKMTSASREGYASITIEFEASADLEDSLRELRDEVENAKTVLPEDASDPMVAEIRMDDFPIVTYSILGNVAPDELKTYAERLQDRLEAIPGVSKVPLFGIEREEMQVYVDARALDGYGLSIGQIVSVIRANHADMPVGSLRSDDYTYQVSLKGQLNTPEDLLNLPVASKNGESVYLRDVAEVREAFAEKTTASTVYQTATGEEKRSVTLQLYKRTGGNILGIADQANEAVREYGEQVLPPGMEVLVTNDFSVFTRDDVNTLGRTGVQTAIIIFLILLIALGFREAFLTGFTLPLIFMIAFLGVYVAGETLNSLVLFSLILSLGLIVDTSIVIMEGIHHFLKERGLPPKEAALLSIKTFKAPLTSSTLTTISAFIPLAIMTGIMGDYIRHIPITVTIALAASLFVAIFMLPAIAVRAFRNFDPSAPRREPLLSHVIKPLRAWHANLLRKTLPHRGRRWLWVIMLFLLFGVTLSFPSIGVLKTEMFGGYDLDFFYVNIEAPVGSSVEETARVTRQAEELVKREVPELDNFVTVIGGVTTITMSSGFGSSEGSNLASITVNLHPTDERDIKSYEITNAFREKVKEITDAKVEVQDLGAGPPAESAIALRILGEDVSETERVARDVVRELETIDGVLDPETSIETGTGEFQFTLKRDALSYYGLTAVQVASELRTAVFGNDSIKIIRSGEETPVVIRLDFRDEACLNDPVTQLTEKRDRLTVCSSRPRSVAEIGGLLIQTPMGAVPVSALADVSVNPTVRAIRHEDGEQVVHVQAANRQDVTAVEITEELQKKIAAMDVPEGVRVEYGGELQQIVESFQSIWNALIVGLVLIAFFLVLQFKSYKQPLIILFSLPLALIGVFIGLALLGLNFSFPAFIGIVALAGIVVNDSIVLIDRINKNIQAGFEKMEAVIVSAGERLQPIILTTVTTAAGVLPLAFTNELWQGLAWTIVFGIIFATVLSLVMVPIFYMMLEGKGKSE